jgi:membrane fusion protein (multidrug efflux system)
MRKLSWVFLATLLQAQQPVDAVRVTSRTLDRKVPLPGEFVPYESVAIHARVTGFVDKIEVDRGSQVKEGDVLATLTAPEMTAQIAEALAKVKAMEGQEAEAHSKRVAAKSTFDRMQAAAATPGVVAGNELVQAEQQVQTEQAREEATHSSVEASRAAVKALQYLQSYLRVTAPFSGTITERFVHPGALAGPAGPVLFQLDQLSRLRLIVAVPEVDVSGIVPGAKVPFTVPAYPSETFYGTIARNGHAMDRKTRSMPIELDVDNARGRLAPGMFPTVSWPIRMARASLLVPPASIVVTTEKTFVNRIRDGKVEWVIVTRGAALSATTGDLVEVSGDLHAGDIIARRGTDELREGTQVKPQIK